MESKTTIQRQDQLIAAGSLLVFVYFFSMSFLGSYRDQFVLIGVIIELATIPLLILLVVLMVVSFIRLLRHFGSFYIRLSVLLLIAVILRLIFIK